MIRSTKWFTLCVCRLGILFPFNFVCSLFCPLLIQLQRCCHMAYAIATHAHHASSVNLLLTFEPLCHINAGLISFTTNNHEIIKRKIVCHISQFTFCDLPYLEQIITFTHILSRYLHTITKQGVYYV